MAIDADSRQYIDDVKKGKPRRFAMVMKGEKILSLVVYKKGSLEKYKKQAKEQGKGEFFHGVIDGKGQNIVFKLCRSDGFEAAPGKEIKLKQYLKEEAGLQFKPTYDIVNELPSLTETAEDDEATNHSAASSDALVGELPMPATAAAQGEAADDSAIADKLVQALRMIAPEMNTAMAAEPTRKREILAGAAAIKSAVAAGQLDEAKAQLVQYRKFLNGCASAKTNTAPVATSRTAPTAGMSVWQAARSEVVEQIRAIANLIAATKDPDAKGAIIELQSIIKNLTLSPETPNQVAELDRYLRDDDVITAAEEVPPSIGTLNIRAPLLRALAELV